MISFDNIIIDNFKTKKMSSTINYENLIQELVPLLEFKPTKNVNPQGGFNSSWSMTEEEINLSPNGADLNLLRFKNYNGTFYIKANQKWVYFHPSNKTKYAGAYNEIFHLLLMDTFPKKNIPREVKILDKVIKKLFEYITKNVPNTAHDDVTEQLPLPTHLPVEILNMIIDFIPNDTNMDIITNILKKIMLPKAEIIRQLILFFPHIETEPPTIIEIYYKYVVMFATNNLIELIRNKICDEYQEKKSYPANKSQQYLPFSKDEHKYIKKYIYLNQSNFSGFDKLTQCIQSSMEQLLFSELSEHREIKNFEKYDVFKEKFLCRELFPYKSEVDIFSMIFKRGYDCEFYKKDWKTEIPELLSNTTNILTTQDIYMIKQFPIWEKNLVENLSTDILKMMTHFSKLEKYDRTCKSMIERVEKLIKLQNKYQYHMLQRCKNECRNEMKKIEKFTK